MRINYFLGSGNALKKGVVFRYVELSESEVIEKDSFVRSNFLIFNLAGKMEYVYNGLKPQVLEAGEMLFLASHFNCRFTVKEKVQLILLAFDELYSLCDKFTFQALYPVQSMLRYEFAPLDIRYPLDDFLALQKEYLAYPLLSTDLFEEKQKELFIIFRAYYLKEELAMFFYPIIAKSIDFKNMVLTNFKNNMCLDELAEVCHCSKRVFQRRFKEIFGEPPEQWILREKSKQIRYYLSTSNISFKEIIDKLGFDSAVHLNKFCKTWFGMSPTELKRTLLLQKEIKL